MPSSNRQILFVNSALRSQGTPSDFRIVFGNDVLRAKRGYRTRLAISEATINRSWYNVLHGQNTFTLGDDTYSVPPGQYNTLDLRSMMSSLLPQGWSVTYSRLTSKFTITRPSAGPPVYMLSLNTLGPLLGFVSNSTVFLSADVPSVTSSQPARINVQNSLFVHTDLMKSGGSVLDNMGPDTLFNDSSVLAKIPIDVPPNDNIVFRMQNDLEFVELPHGHTDAMRFWVTDENNVGIPLSFEWTCTLVVIHEPEHDTSLLEVARETRDYLRLQALDQTLSVRNNKKNIT